MKWDAGSNVTLPRQELKDFLNELAKKVEHLGIRPYVTSGYRSPMDQARVVCNNFVSTGGENLSIYGHKTQAAYREYCPSNMDALVSYEADRLESLLRKDPNYQGHGSGWSLDLRVRDLSATQKLEYKKILEEMGAKVLWEKHPEHFHIWLGAYRPTPWTRYLLLGSITLLIGAVTYKFYFDT